MVTGDKPQGVVLSRDALAFLEVILIKECEALGALTWPPHHPTLAERTLYEVRRELAYLDAHA